jgi:hypothetical protein
MLLQGLLLLQVKVWVGYVQLVILRQSTEFSSAITQATSAGDKTNIIFFTWLLDSD